MGTRLAGVGQNVVLGGLAIRSRSLLSTYHGNSTEDLIDDIEPHDLQLGRVDHIV
jgi:hypothetical protein